MSNAEIPGAGLGGREDGVAGPGPRPRACDPSDEGSLENRIGYRFRDERLKDQVFTHRSFRNECQHERDLDNERLEFLGDAVLGFLISRILFERFADKSEGELSRLRSHLVSAARLAEKARTLDLGRELRVGRGEEKSGGREKHSILADAYESLVAGIVLDGGLEEARLFVEREFREEIDLLGEATSLRDDKSHLQEALHVLGRPEPRYHVIQEAGPDHLKVFEVAVLVDGVEIGRGIGSSKKAAQQEAAREALLTLRDAAPGASAAG